MIAGGVFTSPGSSVLRWDPSAEKFVDTGVDYPECVAKILDFLIW